MKGQSTWFANLSLRIEQSSGRWKARVSDLRERETYFEKAVADEQEAKRVAVDFALARLFGPRHDKDARAIAETLSWRSTEADGQRPDAEAIYHLTAGGWRSEPGPGDDLVETWQVLSESIGTARVIRWRRTWHSERVSLEDRKLLFRKFGAPAGCAEDSAVTAAEASPVADSAQ